MKTYLRDYRSPLVSIGRYRCRDGTVPIGPEQQSQHCSISVTQRGAFGLHRDGRFEVIDRTVAALFNAGDVYRTSHPDVCDDDGYYLYFERATLVDVLGRHDTRVLDRPERPFRHVTVPLPPRVTLLAAALLRDVGRFERGGASGFELEERALAWLDALFAAAPSARDGRTLDDGVGVGAGSGSGARAASAHRELANEARRLLALRFTEPLALPELAARLGVSPFHLCRVFRRVTGSTLHAQLEHNRLAAALDAVSDPQRDLSRIALDYGFSSHSHFTARFRRAFGVTPSQFRRAGS